MWYEVEAACGCHIGKVRGNNEDNFFFDGKNLPVENNGLSDILYAAATTRQNLSFAVFDGMGGENFGEMASFAASEQMKQTKRRFAEYLLLPRMRMHNLVMELNDAVVQSMKICQTEHMGTTMVSLHVWGRKAYACNLGDSRAYLLRKGTLRQLSKDHVSNRPGRKSKKPPLTQHLGLDPDEMLIEPHIVGVELKPNDVFLLCSDGLTDMLTDEEIREQLNKTDKMDACADYLLQAALENGGRDNITVIACRIKDSASERN